VKAWLAHLGQFDAELAKSKNSDIARLRETLGAGARAVGEAVDWLLATFGSDVKAASSGAVPFLRLMGIVAGGWQMGVSALAAEAKLAEHEVDRDFYAAKILTARFYADQLLTQAPGLAATVKSGGAGALGLAEEQFLAA
jgi:acyl-CoA dehydrogenase